MARPARRRPLWLTVPLYVVLGAVVGINMWAAEFWFRVGGRLGLVIGGAATVVVVAGGLLLAVDARRQRLLGRSERVRSLAAGTRVEGTEVTSQSSWLN